MCRKLFFFSFKPGFIFFISLPKKIGMQCLILKFFYLKPERERNKIWILKTKVKLSYKPAINSEFLFSTFFLFLFFCLYISFEDYLINNLNCCWTEKHVSCPLMGFPEVNMISTGANIELMINFNGICLVFGCCKAQQ